MKNLKKILLIMLLAIGYWLLVAPLLVLAGDDFMGSPALVAQETLDSAVVIEGKAATTNQVIANMAKLTLGLVGVLALIMIIIGGITWMTSAGNAEQVKKGKGTLVWASIGLVVCFLAYSLVTFVIKTFIGVAGS